MWRLPTCQCNCPDCVDDRPKQNGLLCEYRVLRSVTLVNDDERGSAAWDGITGIKEC